MRGLCKAWIFRKITAVEAEILRKSLFVLQVKYVLKGTEFGDVD
jgi:hypothetical protein